MEVDATDDVPLGSPELQIPSEGEFAHDAVVRSAVNDLHQRPLLLGVEVGRVDDPLLHVAIICALEGHALDLAELPFLDEVIVEMFECDRVIHSRPMRIHRARAVEAASEEDSETPSLCKV